MYMYVCVRTHARTHTHTHTHTFKEDANKTYGFMLYLCYPVQYVYYSLKHESLVFSKKFVVTNETAWCHDQEYHSLNYHLFHALSVKPSTVQELSGC